MKQMKMHDKFPSPLSQKFSLFGQKFLLPWFVVVVITWGFSYFFTQLYSWYYFIFRKSGALIFTPIILAVVSFWLIVLGVIALRQKKFPRKWFVATLTGVPSAAILPFLPIALLLWTMYHGAFSSADFPQTTLAERNITSLVNTTAIYGDILPYKIQSVSPDQKKSVESLIDPNRSPLVLTIDGKSEEILKKVSKARGDWHNFNWSSDSSHLIACFNQVEGRPTDADFVESCFVYDLADKSYKILPNSQGIIPYSTVKKM